MASPMRQSHPLERKYIVFDHRECDREDEGSALAVYQMKKGKLVPIFNPGALYDPHDCNVGFLYDPQSKRHITPTGAAVNLLKKKGVREVVSVTRSKDFFGIPYGCQLIDGAKDEEGAYTNWFEYEDVYTQSDSYLALTSAGIAVRFFDDDRGGFFDDA